MCALWQQCSGATFWAVVHCSTGVLLPSINGVWGKHLARQLTVSGREGRHALALQPLHPGAFYCAAAPHPTASGLQQHRPCMVCATPCISSCTLLCTALCGPSSLVRAQQGKVGETTTSQMQAVEVVLAVRPPMAC